MRMDGKWNAHIFSICVLVSMQNGAIKSFIRFLKSQIIDLPYDPANLLLDIFPREIKSYVSKKTCTQLFITSLFITDPNEYVF